MTSGKKLKRRSRRPYTPEEVMQIRRLAKWWDGIADDYAAAIAPTGAHPLDGDLMYQVRVARRAAALLRAKIADR